MERVISDEEKLRRAIEISQRRNNSYYTKTMATRVNINDKKEYKLFKRMILQIIICLLIYSIFHLINTTNYIFSDKVIGTTKEILNYDINFENLYNNCKEYINSKININRDKQEANEINNNVINNQENVVQVLSENILQSNNSVEVIENEEKKEENEISKKREESENEKSQMEQDAETVKKLCKFQKPLSGTITSDFGEREVLIQGMTSDHKGIDIAANSGTKIKAAMKGTVSVAEENSEYGKFIKIVNGDVMTVYAHCKSLKVKVGENVKKGQTIATVGTTGNSTGPHLHFEIRYENRYINPRYVIEF